MSIAFWVNVSALVIALIGMGVSIYQLKKSRDASDAAKDAADEANKSLQQTISLTDTTSLAKDFRNLARFIEEGEYRAATFIIEEQLHPQLIQISNTEMFNKKNRETNMSKLKTEIKLVRNELRKDRAKIDKTSTRKKLLEVADQLESWLGEDRFTLGEDRE